MAARLIAPLITSFISPKPDGRHMTQGNQSDYPSQPTVIGLGMSQ